MPCRCKIFNIWSFNKKLVNIYSNRLFQFCTEFHISVFILSTSISSIYSILFLIHGYNILYYLSEDVNNLCS